MDLGLDGKTFIVTGGTAGLGLATVRALIAEGANVLVTGRTEEKFHRARESLTDGAHRIAYLAGDNADPDLPRRVKAAVMERWGRLDGLLVSVGGPPAGKALAIPDETWRAAFESVFLGAVRLVRELSPAIAAGGAIALVLAVSAKEAAPLIAISSGLRPGLGLLTKNFADELGPRHVRINALLPGMFATERMRHLFKDNAPDLSPVSLRRVGDPAEFGRMAAILLSPAASYVTGAAIAIGGGRMTMM